MTDLTIEVTESELEALREEHSVVEHPDWVKGTDIAKALNAELEARGLKTIRPQMVYNYMRKGYITTVAPNRVHRDVAEEWVKVQLAKRSA